MESGRYNSVLLIGSATTRVVKTPLPSSRTKNSPVSDRNHRISRAIAGGLEKKPMQELHRQVECIVISSDDEDEDTEEVPTKKRRVCRAKLRPKKHPRSQQPDDDDDDDDDDFVGGHEEQRRQQQKQEQQAPRKKPRLSVESLFQLAEELYQQGEYGRAYTKYRQAAQDAGWRNGRVVYMVQRCHDQRTGVSRETVEKAKNLVARGTEIGTVNLARTFLGDCYFFGHGGFTPNLKEALAQHRAAAAKGDVHGACMVGYAHLYLEEYKTAEEYLLKAAACGHVIALFELFQLYDCGGTSETGRDVKSNSKKASEFLQRSLVALYPPAFLEKGRLHEEEGDFAKALAAYDVGAKGGMRACARCRDDLVTREPHAAPFGRWTHLTHSMFPVYVRAEIFIFLCVVKRLGNLPSEVRLKTVSFIASDPRPE